MKFKTLGFVVSSSAFAAGSIPPPSSGVDREWRRGVPPISAELESARRASAALVELPRIEEVFVNDKSVWRFGTNEALPIRLRVGDAVRLAGHGFGAGPDVDFSKVLIGNARVLERNLNMFKGQFDYLNKYFYESAKVFDRMPKSVGAWTREQVEFRVPATVQSGDLRVQVQKRTGANPSLVDASRPHSVWDPLTERILEEAYPHPSDVVSILGDANSSQSLRVEVENPEWSKLVARGEAIFWAYDYNIGMTHHLVELDWSKIMKGEAVDPITGQTVDPTKSFGAIPLTAGQVPDVALKGFDWDEYPIPTPLFSLAPWGKRLQGGAVRPTPYVGFVYAEGTNPITGMKENHIGFNCASCHAAVVDYETPSGERAAKIVPGIPNPDWTLRWATLGKMHGVKVSEENADGKKEDTDKTQLVAAMPKGTGEHSIIRGSKEKTIYADDGLYSPIAIPDVTRHLPLRRALSRTEMVAGFEGSYIHSEEPDGALGAMRAEDLKALTAYMGTLDVNDPLLKGVGLYRTLKTKGLLGDLDGAREGEFLARKPASFPKLASRLKHGSDVFQAKCQRCHADNGGTWTDESFVPLSEVGLYFSPTLYNKQVQAIRTAPIRNLYFTAARGLLHDGHVKSVEDLVNPERLNTSSALYKKYYTMHEGSFAVAKGTPEQERATRRQAYFVDVPWDTTRLYWDYAKMRREFGPRELGAKGRVDLPEAPHPWAAASVSDVDDLTLFLMTL